MAPAAAPPPALVAPAPEEVSFGRVAGIALRGAHEVRVRVGARLVGERRIRGRSFDFYVSLPRGEQTVRVQAGRRTFVVPHVVGLPLRARPAASPGRLDRVLQAQVVPLARAFGGTSAVFVKDLGTGTGAAWNARARFPAASTLKLAIAVEALRLLGGKPMRGSWVDGLLRRMLLESSNDAANSLEVWMGGSTPGGGARVDDLLHLLGLFDSEMYGGYLRDTQSRRPIPVRVESAPPFGRGKYTSALDLARLLIDVHLAAEGEGTLAARCRGEFTPSDARYLLYLLSRVPDRGKLGRYLGSRPVVLAHKAGWISSARHDAGLVYYPDGVFVSAVMTWNGGDYDADVLAGRVAVTALSRFRSAAGTRRSSSAAPRPGRSARR
jgi:beta-lactamase class A